MAKFLDASARAAFKQAIETIEGCSAAEVVVAVRQRSAAYHHANVIVGVAVAFAGLAAMLYSSHVFQLSSILVDPFVVGGLAGLVVELVPQLKRYLTRPTARAEHVVRAARATFVERGVHHTIGRSGLLVYISWLERRIALVADAGLAASLPDGVLARAEAELTRTMREGGAAVARRLQALSPDCERAMPRSADDVNELPDEIDGEA